VLNVLDLIFATAGMGHDRQLFAEFRWPAVPQIADENAAGAKKMGFDGIGVIMQPPAEAGERTRSRERLLLRS
jgi:hypothetical protein